MKITVNHTTISHLGHTWVTLGSHLGHTKCDPHTFYYTKSYNNPFSLLKKEMVNA